MKHSTLFAVGVSVAAAASAEAPAATLTFPDAAYGGLSFTNISVTEVDTGDPEGFNRFVDSPGLNLTAAGLFGPVLAWGALNAGVYGGYGPVSEVLNFSYTVTAAPGRLIDGIGQLYTADVFSGPGKSMTVAAHAYTPGGMEIGANTWTEGASNVVVSPLSQAAPVIDFRATMTMALDGSATADSEILFSVFQHSFATIAGAPVPEPAAWTTMLLGFGLAGAILRRRRRVAAP